MIVSRFGVRFGRSLSLANDALFDCLVRECLGEEARLRRGVGLL
jgi:hypothetical protein